MDMKTVKVGTVAGRHPLPVDEYLLEQADPGQCAYDAAYMAASRRGYEAVVNDEILEVYYTGLTEVTLGTIDGLDEAGATYRLMRYNLNGNTYEPLQRRVYVQARLF